MRKGLFAAALLATGLIFSTVGCTTNKKSNDTFEVSITNKTEMQAEWLSDAEPRTLGLTIKKNGAEQNATKALQDGELKLVSSAEAVAKVVGRAVTPVAGGKATITVTYGTASDSVDVNITQASSHGKTADDPLTVQEAIAICLEAGETQTTVEYYIKGYVSKIGTPYDPGYGNITIYIADTKTDTTNTIDCYRAVPQTGVDGTKISLETEVLVSGYLLNYGGNTPELATGGKIHSATGGKQAETHTVTTAEALAAAMALDPNTTTVDIYVVTGYVTAVTAGGFYMSDTKGAVEPTNDQFMVYGYNGANVAEITVNAKVKATGNIKYYKSTSDNTKYNYELVSVSEVVILEPGDAPVPATEVTVAEALAVIDALADGATTSDKYAVSGVVVEVTTAYSDTYHNISFTMGDTAGDAKLLTVYRGGCDAEVGAKVKANAEVKVTGFLQKYVKDAVTTPELTNGAVEVTKEAPQSQTHTYSNAAEMDTVATVMTVDEVAALTAQNKKVLAKVTGVAENKYGDAKYGNFHLVNPSTKAEITVYGGYTDTVYTEEDGTFTATTKTTAVTAAIVGHQVTVYGTIGVYSNKGQVVDTLVVVGDAYTANVEASVTVNNDTMGTASLSATSVAYGGSVTVTATPNSGYQLKSIVVNHASSKETLDGVYSFNASIKNEVVVTFEAVSTSPTGTLQYKGDSNTTANAYANDAALTTGLNLDNTIFNVHYDKNGATSDAALRTDGIRMYATKQTTNGNKFTVSIDAAYEIKSIAIEFDSGYSATAQVLVGGDEVTGTAGAYDINASSFVLFNNNSAVSSNTQVRFQSIVITYDAK